MSVGLFTMRALLALLALALAAPLAEARDDAPFGGETFHEESLVRPLPDGNVVFVAHFKQEAPLSATHFETFPKAMAQIARASRVAEFELSFTQGRWDTPRWGRAPLGHRPIGAELWASFHTPDSPDVDVEAATDASWNNLTSLLGGQLCASLGRLDRAEIVVPEARVPPLGRHRVRSRLGQTQATRFPPRGSRLHGESHPLAQIPPLPRPVRRGVSAQIADDALRLEVRLV